jgi:hypothetical protein
MDADLRIADDLGSCSAGRRGDRAQGRTNARFLDRKGWENEVDKMIKAYGAPIGENDAKAIVDYLAANYGADR